MIPWLLLACAAARSRLDAPPPSVPATLPAGRAPSAPTTAGIELPPEAQAIYRALSVRDPEPDCAHVEALSPTPLATLLLVIQHAQQPPWVGIRAATCVLDRHAQLASPALLDWVEGPDTRGLALLVLDRLDRLPDGLAQELARAALAGPYAADAADRLDSSSRAELRALLSLPTDPR